MKFGKTVIHRKHVLLAIGLTALAAAGLGALLTLRQFEWSGRGRGGVYHLKRSWDLSGLPQSERKVRIDFGDITDEELHQFLLGRDLIWLSVEGCKNITDYGLEPLSLHRNLRHLDVRYTQAGNGLGKILSRSRNLQNLYLDHSQVQEFPEEFFSDKSELGTLHLSGCQLTEQMIVRCATLPHLGELMATECKEVPPHWFAHLGRSQSLYSIYIGGNQLNVEVLRSIMLAPKIMYFSVRNATGVTGQDMRVLGAEFPHITIYDSPE